MSNAEGPYLRVLLYPVAEQWSGGPGASYPAVRFGLMSGWRVSGTEAQDAPARSLRVAMLIPEMPFSVLPHGVQKAANILWEEDSPDTWRGHPLPLWRGIPCRPGRAYLTLSDERSHQGVELPVEVLLPERDPPGPVPEVIFLGMRFLSHYGFRVVLDYTALRFTARFEVDSTIPVGALEKE